MDLLFARLDKLSPGLMHSASAMLALPSWPRARRCGDHQKVAICAAERDRCWRRVSLNLHGPVADGQVRFVVRWAEQVLVVVTFGGPLTDVRRRGTAQAG